MIVRMDTSSTNPAGKDWYRTWFGREYLEVYPHRDEAEAALQVDFLTEKLQLTDNARVLDLCCGSGRHAFELAKRGYRVCGVDLSGELLALACARSKEKGGNVLFVRADMRILPLSGIFDAALSLFTSFGYFPTQTEDRKVLEAIARVLKKGGKYLLDHLNPEHVRANLVEKDESGRIGFRVLQERWIDEEGRRINKRITITREGGAEVFNESVRMYSFAELRAMLRDAGFKIQQVFGDFGGNEFSDLSPRMIILAEKN